MGSWSHVTLPYLDDYVRSFVHGKTGLRVCLDLQSEWAAVRPQEASGSVALALFWSKVLQHRDNYPSDRVHYHRGRDAATGAERLLIRVEDVTVSLNLKTGQLEVSGHNALPWLKERFLAVLRAYDGLKDTQDWYADEAADKEFGRRRRQLVPAEVSRVRLGVSEQELGTQLDGQRLGDLWSGPTLDARLERLRRPSMQPTSGVLEPLWRSLLARWLSDSSTQVTLVCTGLDAERLRVVCELACQYKGSANFGCVHAPIRADAANGASLGEVRAAAVASFNAQDQMWLEYKLLACISTPLSSHGLNLIAGLRLGHAQVLLTSAPFTSDGIGAVGRVDLAQFLELPESLFQHDFLQPLTSRS